MEISRGLENLGFNLPPLQIQNIDHISKEHVLYHHKVAGIKCVFYPVIYEHRKVMVWYIESGNRVA